MPEKLRFDSTWLFHLGDIPSPVPNTHIAAYMNHKSGWARGAARYNFDDSDWRALDLPHDWSVEGPFDPANHMDAGFLPRGVAWYRRYFKLEEADRSRRIQIRFDAVATHCTVFVNGHLLHRHFNGYTPFTIDISDVAHFGEQLNVIAVRVDASYMEGWWYEGAGIYRHVWMIKSSPLHVSEFGVFVNPRKEDSRQGRQEEDGESWDTRIGTTIENDSYEEQTATLVSTLIDPAGANVAADESEFSIGPRSSTSIQQSIPTTNPQLWAVEARNLYRVRTEIVRNGDVIDDDITTFGYRTIRFDPQRGFFLNEKPMKLLGTCNHQDHAGLGVALPDSIHEFRIRRLLEMGSNAYRCAHHPPAPELLDACDRLGMLVMDENRTFGSSPEILEQLRAMVRRDRNHPCVILWSICNEESIQTTPISGNIARAMVHEVKKLDDLRPVTAAVSGGILNDGCIGDELDVMCINYQLPAHDAYHAKRPTKPLIAAESHCVMSTRGVYKTDEDRGVFAGDDSAKHPWGETARQTWRFIKERDSIAGLFAWTGFDYRGEPAPGRWPIVCSQLGMMDVCGFAKDSFWLHKAYFTCEPFVHLSPHWNWEPSRMVRVIAYSNCDEVEVFLNDRSLGRKRIDPVEMVDWQVEFEPGMLRAIGYRHTAAVVQASVETTGAAVHLELATPPSCTQGGEQGGGFLATSGKFGQAESHHPYPPPRVLGGGVVAAGCAIPIIVAAVDTARRRVPTADNLIAFEIAGPAKILGVANGDPTSHEPDKSNSRCLFNGLAQLIIETTGEAGEITIIAISEGLAPATLKLHSNPGPSESDSVPIARKRHYLTDWRRSPITQLPPDVNQAIFDADMNTWERITIGPGQTAGHVGGYAIYRSTYTPPKAMQKTGWRIVISGISGSAFADEIELDGGSHHWEKSFAPSSEKQTISVLVRGDEAQPAQIIGPIEILPPE